MGAVLAEFFRAIGSDITLPTNMIELIPYLLSVFLGILAVVLTFAVLIAIVRAIFNAGRF